MQILKQDFKTKFAQSHIEDNLRDAERQLSLKQNQMHSNPLNLRYAEMEQEAAEVLLWRQLVGNTWAAEWGEAQVLAREGFREKDG
ncbi:unnamed protein product [Amaranthus hypochondriacus]